MEITFPNSIFERKICGVGKIEGIITTGLINVIRLVSKERIMKAKYVYSAVAVFVLLMFVSSCATTSRIESDPQGAKVYINGDYLGETPLQETLSNFIGNNYTIRLEKSGYRTLVRVLDKEGKILEATAGYFLLVPLLWVYGPKSYYYFTMDKLTDN